MLEVEVEVLLSSHTLTIRLMKYEATGGWARPQAPVWPGIISLNVACIARPPASSRGLAWDIYVFVSTNNIDLCFTHSDNQIFIPL